MSDEIVKEKIRRALLSGPDSCLLYTSQTNFNTYQVLRMSEAPAIEVYLIENTESPGGMGEPGTSAIVPAVTNAIFAATGKRLRKLPVDPAELKHV